MPLEITKNEILPHENMWVDSDRLMVGKKIKNNIKKTKKCKKIEKQNMVTLKLSL